MHFEIKYWLCPKDPLDLVFAQENHATFFRLSPFHATSDTCYASNAPHSIQEGKVRQSRAFKRFVRDYGTHFVSSSLMGAKVSAISFHDGQERVKFGRKGDKRYSRLGCEKLLSELATRECSEIFTKTKSTFEETRAHPRKFIWQKLLNCSETFTREQFGLALKSGDGEEDEDEDEEDEAMDRSFR